VDPLHCLSRKLDRLAAAADRAAARGVEPAEAVADPEDLVRRDAIVREGEDDVLDDVVEAWVWIEREREGEEEGGELKQKNISLVSLSSSSSSSSSLSLSLFFQKKNNSPGHSPPQVTIAAVVVAGSA